MGDEYTKTVIVGNLAHSDGIALRLKKASVETGFPLVIKEYPIADKANNPLWPGRFPDAEALEKFRKSVASKKSWEEEYMLKPPESEAALIKPGWIKQWEACPTSRHPQFAYYAIGVDLAIKQTDSADKTAMVSAIVLNKGNGEKQIFILPTVINRKMTHLYSLDCAEKMARSLGTQTFVFVEDVGYQASFIEQLLVRKIKTEPFAVGGHDKYARLASVSHLVQSNNVWFAPEGNEELLTQLLEFPNGSEDDLVDAFTVLLHKILEKKPNATPEVFCTGSSDRDD